MKNVFDSLRKTMNELENVFSSLTQPKKNSYSVAIYFEKVGATSNKENHLMTGIVITDSEEKAIQKMSVRILDKYKFNNVKIIRKVALKISDSMIDRIKKEC